MSSVKHSTGPERYRIGMRQSADGDADGADEFWNPGQDCAEVSLGGGGGDAEGESESPLTAKELGRRGEDAAAAFLECMGYEILERNFTCFAGEADIIAYGEDALHFVEVKTRTSDCCGFPAEAVTQKKRLRYERIVECYLQDYDGPCGPIVFDVIAIKATGPERGFLKIYRNVLSGDCS